MAMDAVTPVQHDHGGKRPSSRRSEQLGAGIARRTADRVGVKRQRLSDRRCVAEEKDREQETKRFVKSARSGSPRYCR
jgi:hypothetical protein